MSARITAAILFLFACSLIFYKVFSLGYSLEAVIPQTSYTIELNMGFEGFGDPIQVSTFLPKTDAHQTILSERIDSPNIVLSRQDDDSGNRGIWRSSGTKGRHQISYHAQVFIQPVEYKLDPELRIPETYNTHMQRYLQGTKTVQIEDPLIKKLAHRYSDPEGKLVPTLRRLYDYVSSLTPRKFKGTTDAVTAAKLGEASCNGKSRLFIAMARRLNIPARLVGGIILRTGSKRTSHQWLEVYAAGHWIPIDTLNGHFAELPRNYLALYRNDHNLFRHSRNINFDYLFKISRRVIPNQQLVGFLDGHSFNLYAFLRSFKQVNISLNLLRIILMLPLGALLVVISRNVIGLSTFGTFLPALMAVASRDTGLISGIAAFSLVLLTTSIARVPMEKMRILHTPKLGAMMIVVIATILGLAVVSQEFHLGPLSSIGSAGLFPVVILTITSERFAITVTEEGWKVSIQRMLQTMIVMVLCFTVMESLALQALILSFPEILIIVLAINLWIGSWVGIRLIELYRFRSILFSQPTATLS